MAETGDEMNEYDREWFNYWASDRKLVKRAREIAALRIASKRLERAMTEIADMIVQWLIRVTNKYVRKEEK